MEKRYIFITWNTIERSFTERKYVGGGEFDVYFNTETVKRFALFSELSDENMEKAQDYITQDRPEASIEILTWPEAHIK